MIWRAWAAVCVFGTTLVVPMVFVWFAGGSAVIYLGWPLRYLWAWFLGGPLLREEWIPVRLVAGGILASSLVLGGAVMGDLFGVWALHPGWFVALEVWQRPVYPWIAALPRWSFGGRPGYLWTLAAWTMVEGSVVGGALLVRVGVRGDGRTAAEDPTTVLRRDRRGTRLGLDVHRASRAGVAE